jgi:phage repressor protein C with HTH and peptisase S24 domain
METMGDRLRLVRRKAGFDSARKAALKYGWGVSTYSAHENGQNDYDEEAARAYGKAFKVTAGWLLTGDGVPGPRKTRLLGEVGAGGAVHPFDDGVEEEIDLPPGAPLAAVAVTVKGNSMAPRYFNGERLFYVRDGRAPEEMIGKECVIQLRNGGMLVKTIRKSRKRGLFTLESWNQDPLPDQAIEWAAPVRWTERV